MHLSLQRAQVYQMDDPWNDLGGGVPPIGIKIKYPMCGISRSPKSGIYKWCHSNNQVMSIKNTRFSSLNHLPQMQTFASMRSTPFIEINDKGERLYKHMKALEEIETKK